MKAKGREGVGGGAEVWDREVCLCKKPPSSRWEGETTGEEELKGREDRERGPGRGDRFSPRDTPLSTGPHNWLPFRGIWEGEEGLGTGRMRLGNIPWLSWAG